MNKELANLLFPNIKITVDEIEAKYPARDLKEELTLQDLHLLLQDLCM